MFPAGKGAWERQSTDVSPLQHREGVCWRLEAAVRECLWHCGPHSATLGGGAAGYSLPAEYQRWLRKGKNIGFPGTPFLGVCLWSTRPVSRTVGYFMPPGFAPAVISPGMPFPPSSVQLTFTHLM